MASPNEPAKLAAPADLEPILTDLLGEDIVTVIVGAAAKKYRLHKKLLCHHSTFFDAAFNGGFRESNSNELRLPEEETSAFDMFVHWLYCGFLPCQLPLGEPLDYLSVYAMGEKWMIPRLQNRVFNRMYFFWTDGSFPSSFFFERLYEITSQGCKLRQYFVQKLVFHALHNQDLGTVKNVLERNGDLAIDVAKEMCLNLSIVNGVGSDFPSPESRHPCDFHVHDPGKKRQWLWDLEHHFFQPSKKMNDREQTGS